MGSYNEGKIEQDLEIINEPENRQTVIKNISDISDFLDD